MSQQNVIMKHCGATDQPPNHILQMQGDKLRSHHHFYVSLSGNEVCRCEKLFFIEIMMHTKMVGVSYNHRNASELNKFEVSLQRNVCISANIVQPCFKITPNSMLPLYLLKKTVLEFFFPHLHFSCITRVHVYILFPAKFDM